MKEFYFIADFELSPRTLKKKAEKLGIERKTKSVYWSTREYVYYTRAEYVAIMGITEYRSWKDYSCECGEHYKTSKKSRSFTWGIKDKCNKCLKKERLKKQGKLRQTASEKIAEHFKAHYA